jgi:nucleoid-associated protein EbfC
MFGDIGKLLKAASEMKKKMPELQAKLAATNFTGQSGGGMVKATVNGKFQMVDLKLDPQVVKDGDVEMLEDLIKAAVSAAQTDAARAAEAAMKDLTGGMGLPGMEGLLS